MQELWNAVDAVAWGAVDFDGILAVLDETARQACVQACPHARSVLIAAFPYFAGTASGNIARYARGRDYHLVLGECLQAVCDALQARCPEAQFVPWVDSSPLPERAIARLAGIGEQGWNNLLLLPQYGSYVFLGTILTDAPIEATRHSPPKVCTHCGACRRACPTHALSEDGFFPEKCLSHLSQKKGDLLPWEETALQKSPLVWGCDICQSVCPCNQAVPLSPIPAFRENLLHSLKSEDLEGLSNRSFREAYGDRAFAWRGVNLLRRNLQRKA